MKITWMGHSCFLLETEKGTRVITDPYESGSYSGAIGYGPIDTRADIVTVSHQHADHNYTKGFSQAEIIDREGTHREGDVEIEGISTFHDKEQGASRGKNIIFIITSEGLRIVHFGDLGTLDIDYSKFVDTDIALVPVGGIFTIDAQEAGQLIKKINPKISIPQHFKTPKLGFNIAGVDEFLSNRQDYEQKQILEVTLKNIDSFKKIIVLNHQR